MSDAMTGFKIWCEFLFGFFLNIKIYKRHQGWSFYLSTERFFMTLGKVYFSIGMDYRPKIIPYKRIINWEVMYLFKQENKEGA